METFGRYQLHEKLGQGGMGVVFRAFDTVLQRVVALKLVETPGGLNSDLRERFFREARAAGHLSHKNIVTIYDLGEEDGRPYIAMEYLDGEDLQKRLARPEKMSLRHKLDLAIEICQGVEYAHAHGVIHRDLKPANVHITDSGSAKILDFGLARLLASQLTQSNMLMGTLNYMAPEQVRGERADQRSDIFSMGVVLYELLGGRKAFEGDSVASTLYKILQETPEPLSNIDPGLPPELVAIIDKAMAKLRDERYTEMIALRVDLETFRHQHQASVPVTTPVPGDYAPGPTVISAGPVRPASAPARPVSGAIASHQGRTIAVAAIAVLVVAIAGAWLVGWKFSSPPQTLPATGTPPPEDPMAGRLRAAQQALDARQFATALSAAEGVLRDAPQSAEAQRIRAAARNAALADALERGARHLASGATREAIQAAGEALALAPDSAEARRILAGAQISAPDADAARARMAEGRSAAETAGAARYAASALTRASRVQQDGDRLYKAKRFADAASRYYEAGGLFQNAATAARTVAATQAAASRPGPASAAPAAAAPPPAAEPPPTAVSTAPAAPPPSVPVEQPVVLPQPTAPPAAPPAAAPSPTPAPEIPAQVSAEERINELIGRYREALESRSFDQVKRLWPSLGGAAEAALRQEFQHARQITVGIADRQISVSNNSAKVSFIRTYSILTIEGQRLQSTSLAVMDVHRAGNSWVIDAIRFTPR